MARISSFVSVIALVLASIAAMAITLTAGDAAGVAILSGAVPMVTLPIKRGRKMVGWELNKVGFVPTLFNSPVTGEISERLYETLLNAKNEEVLFKWDVTREYWSGHDGVNDIKYAFTLLFFDFEEGKFYGGKKPYFFYSISYATRGVEKLFYENLFIVDGEVKNSLHMKTKEGDYTLLICHPKLERQIRRMRKEDICKEEWINWISYNIDGFEGGDIQILTE